MKEKIKIVCFALILANVFSGLMVGVDFFTKERIQKNEELSLKSAILRALEIKYDKENIEQIFQANIEPFQKGNFTFYRTKDKEIAFEFQGYGLWGPISGILALKSDVQTIKRIEIIHQEETPGLGGRIAEEDFLSQFKNKKIFPQILILARGKAKNENEVDAITGATMTSKALERLLNKNIKEKLRCLKN